jgi:phosphoglycolate phosphatase-like HAD superfamily hydrolase
MMDGRLIPVDPTSQPSALHALRRRSHWIFDLDGTLTVPVHDFAYIRRELGVPDGSDILGFLASLSHEEARPRHLRLNEIERDLTAVTTIAEGARELAGLLHRSGTHMGILTRNTRENALRTLEGIGLARFFPLDCVMGRDEALPKPDPDGILKLAAIWGTAPSETVMVGDYLFDLQTGRAAGSTTVHVDRTGTFPWPGLADLGVMTLAHLANLLERG